MRKIVWMVFLISGISLSAQAGTQLRLINPSYSAFKMYDGIFSGTAGVMCGEKGAISYTHNEGKTWKSKNLAPYQDLHQVFMEGPLKVWVLSDSLLYYSTDGGQSFQIIFGAPADKKLLRFRKKGNNSWILAADKSTGQPFYLLRSTDEWQSAPEVITLTMNNVVDFDFSDTQQGMLITNTAFYRTQDEGSTYTMIQEAGTSEYLSQISWAGGQVWYASGYTYTYAPSAAVSPVARVWKSTDGGFSWNQLSLPFNMVFNSFSHDLQVKDEFTVMLGLYESGEEGTRWPVLVSTNGGLTWNTIQIEPNLLQTQFQTKSCWVMISDNKFWALEDKSLWSLSYSFNGTQFFFADDVVTRKIKDIVINAPQLFSGSRLFMINGGVSDFIETTTVYYPWDTVAGTSLFPTGTLDRIAFGSRLLGIATSPRITLSTFNGGVSWVRFNYNSSLYLTLHDLEFPSPVAAYRRMTYTDPNTGKLTQLVEKTIDLGQSWTPVSIPDLTIYRMVFVNDQKGFLFGHDENSGEWGFYKTTDGAQHWEWNALPSGITVTKVDMPRDSVAIIGGDNRMFRLDIHNVGYSISEIALPVGKLQIFDFSDGIHGVVVMEDSLFTRMYWTNTWGEDWIVDPMLLPRGFTGVNLTSNFLNGYLYGLRNVLLHIDDSFVLGNESDLSVNRQVSPNPAQEYVEFSGPGEGMLEVFNLAGQKMFSGRVNYPFRLSVRGWKAGMYFYRLSGENQSLSGKFIVSPGN